jgi:hypothetical protein
VNTPARTGTAVDFAAATRARIRCVVDFLPPIARISGCAGDWRPPARPRIWMCGRFFSSDPVDFLLRK